MREIQTVKSALAYLIIAVVPYRLLYAYSRVGPTVTDVLIGCRHRKMSLSFVWREFIIGLVTICKQSLVIVYLHCTTNLYRYKELSVGLQSERSECMPR